MIMYLELLDFFFDILFPMWNIMQSIFIPSHSNQTASIYDVVFPIYNLMAVPTVLLYVAEAWEPSDDEVYK